MYHTTCKLHCCCWYQFHDHQQCYVTHPPYRQWMKWQSWGEQRPAQHEWSDGSISDEDWLSKGQRRPTKFEWLTVSSIVGWDWRWKVWRRVKGEMLREGQSDRVLWVNDGRQKSLLIFIWVLGNNFCCLVWKPVCMIWLIAWWWWQSATPPRTLLPQNWLCYGHLNPMFWCVDFARLRIFLGRMVLRWIWPKILTDGALLPKG